ncbi:response regulator, partial [bacterium]|nr:response regulator [bacterium]
SIKIVRNKDDAISGLYFSFYRPLSWNDSIRFNIHNNTSRDIHINVSLLEKKSDSNPAPEDWNTRFSVLANQDNLITLLPSSLKLNEFYQPGGVPGDQKLNLAEIENLQITFDAQTEVNLNLGPIEYYQEDAIWDDLAAAVIILLWFIGLFWHSKCVELKEKNIALYVKNWLYAFVLLGYYCVPVFHSETQGNWVLPLLCLSITSIIESYLVLNSQIPKSIKLFLQLMSPLWVVFFYSLFEVQSPLEVVLFVANCLCLIGYANILVVVASIVYLSGYVLLIEPHEAYPFSAIYFIMLFAILVPAIALRVIVLVQASQKQIDILHYNQRATEEKNKNLEAQLLQMQKMEALGQLAGGVAHDFNNFLTGIIGHCEVAKLELKDEDPIRSHFDAIQSAGERVASLTRQLLAFSRKEIHTFEAVNLNDLLRQQEILLRRIVNQGIQLKYEFSSPIEYINADPGLVEQVVLNLVMNARDAMPNGGSIEIQTENETLDEDFCLKNPTLTPGDYVRLSVIDSGQGMTSDMLEHIFEPFFTTKMKGAGTGLGLSTAYGVVKKSGGDILVESAVGEGSKFHLYFPKANAEIVKESDDAVFESVGSETILLVEDDDMVRSLAKRNLESVHYRVLDFSNGNHAIEICSRNKIKIDLLLTDVMMPEINGKDLAEKIKAMYPGMKTVYMSGYPNDHFENEFLEMKNHFFLQKPYTKEKLVQIIYRALHSSKTPGSA